MTVDEAFTETLSRIELNSARVELASTRYAAVKQVLERALPGSRVRQIGSFQRRTKIRPQNLSDELDIDIVATIGTATRIAGPGEGTTPDGAFERVKAALTGNLTYKSMSPRVDAPVVSITYADDMALEVVPAFVNEMVPARSQELDLQCYLIGTHSGQWIAADYDYDARYVSAANTKANSYLVPACKLIKTFIRNKQLGIKSFYTEVLCSLIVPDLVASWQAKGYRWSHRHVFAHSLWRISQLFGTHATLPGSNSPPVQSGLTPLGEMGAKAILTGCADVALGLTGSPEPGTVRSWNELIGNPFPPR